MNPRKKLDSKRIRRATRVSAKLHGTAERPRLVVNRSNRYISAQLIDDVAMKTIAYSSSRGSAKATKTVQAFAAGEALAKKAIAAGVKSAILDRRASKFHGRVKSFADGAKKGGLTI